jgi:lipoprotein-anchoring transpeptidase ErfK/SrfK
MHVTSTYPANANSGVDGASPITITFSDPVAAKTPRPKLQPSVPGSWSSQGYSMVFTPSVPFGPSSQVTISIPGGRSGVRSASGALLTASVTDRFSTASYSQLALSELLTEQGYLPMTFSPISNGVTRAQAALSSPDPASLTLAGEAYSPPAGTFTFDQGYPSSLQSQWTPYSANVLLRGAVMAFESEHNMTVDADLNSKFWNALFLAQERGERNQNGYTYAVADQNDPETLTIYHNGHVVLRSPTNTGIPDSPTVNGTFPVYQKYRFQIMSGTNPDGSSYADPVSFVSYFNGGDAVHYFPRGGYGYQQSLGCVELPYNAAEQAYPYLTYGSLVNVTG